MFVTDPPYGVKKADWDAEFPVEWIPLTERFARGLVMPGNLALAQCLTLFSHRYKDTIALHSLNGMTRSRIAFGNWIPVVAVGDWKWKARPNLLKFTVSTSEKIDHPSPKPIRSMQILFEKYVDPSWSVVDCFMGAGTTLIAAAANGNDAVGIEIEEKYCEVAARRLDTYFTEGMVPLRGSVIVPQPEVLSSSVSL